jgi:decaprenylphospho-beta-D-ribofuranose 2-oxidase
VTRVTSPLTDTQNDQSAGDRIHDETAPRSLLTGWGGTAPSAAHLMSCSDNEMVVEQLRESDSRGVIARGLGRSYGDAAQCAGGRVLSMGRMDRVLATSVDPDSMNYRVKVQAGMSLDALMRTFIPKGWFVPVSPGTRYVSIGGAIAADIHGKNHHVDGSFGDHVTELTLATPTGIHTIGPHNDAELFWATVGGMGLTGVVCDATIRLIGIETSAMRVDTERCSNLEALMATMEERDGAYRYSVAWIDCMAGGRHLGRSVLTRGHHAAQEDLLEPSRQARRLGGIDAEHPLKFAPREKARVPRAAPGGLLNPTSIRAFNEAWYRKTPRREIGRLVPMSRFFHPLDGIEGWNRLYGRAGFVQYQMVIPFGEERTLRKIIERVSRGGFPSFFAVLKRFGSSNQGVLSFPIPGWTLALDLAVGSPAMASLLDELDVLVADAGGRVYLAKDSRLRPEHIGVMYPRLGELDAVRARCDPNGVLRSDLARRLGLDRETTVRGS